MAEKNFQKGKGRAVIIALLFLLGFQVGLVAANQYSAIVQPITNIYNFVQYLSTVVAGLILLFAGITYITSGSDPEKREKAKNMIMYVIIGLIIIWAAPYLIQLVTQ